MRNVAILSLLFTGDDDRTFFPTSGFLKIRFVLAVLVLIAVRAVL